MSYSSGFNILDSNSYTPAGLPGSGVGERAPVIPSKLSYGEDPAILADFEGLVSKYGATTTSLRRSVEHNKKVGGKANSQHLRGTAGDFVVPEENRAAFKEEAISLGYQPIDEGDHIHVQLPHGSGVGGSGGRSRKATSSLNILDSNAYTPTGLPSIEDVPAAEAPTAAAKSPPLPKALPSNLKGMVKGGTGTKSDPLVPTSADTYEDVMANKPAGAWVLPPNGDHARQDDISMWEGLSRNVLKGVSGLYRTGVSMDAATHEDRAAADDATAAAPRMKGKLPGWASLGGLLGGNAQALTNEQLAAHKQKELNAAYDSHQSARTFDDNLTGGIDASVSRQTVEAQSTTGKKTLASYLTHPSVIAGDAVTGVTGMAPAFIISALAPELGPAAFAALSALDAQEGGVPNYLRAHGIDPNDREKSTAFLSNPNNLKDAIHSRDVHAGVSGAAMLALGPAGKLVSEYVAPLEAAMKKTIAQAAANAVVQPAVLIAAESGARAALKEKPQTTSEMISTGIGALPYGLVGAYKGHQASRKADIINQKLDEAGLTQTSADEVAAPLKAAPLKADTEVTLDIKAEQEKIAQRKAKEDAFAQGEQDQKKQDQAGDQANADQEEANKRNRATAEEYAGKTRVEKYPDGSMDRVPVHPPAEVTAEDIKAEREQAQAEEADRLKRVEVGAITERLRKRQDLSAAQKAAADAKAADAAKTAESAARGRQTKHEHGIMDTLVAENPGVDPLTLVEEYQRRLAANPNPPPPKARNAPKATPVAPEAGTPPTATQGAKTGSGLSEKVAAHLKGAGYTDEEIASISPQYAGVLVGNHKAGKPNVKITVPGKAPAPTVDVVDETSQTAQDLMSFQMEKEGTDTPENKKGAYSVVPAIRAMTKALRARGGATAHDVLHLMRQGRFVVVDNAARVGRTESGAASYDTKTGKMYLYTDHLDPNDAVATIIRAIHESTHGGQFNPREGRNQIMKMVMGKGYNEAKQKVISAAASGNELAKKAVEKAEAAATDKATGKIDEQIFDLELMPYFAGEVARARKGFGRMGGVVSDMKAGAKQLLAKHTGTDFGVSLNDIASATQKGAGELAKTDIKGDKGSTNATLNMVLGRKATEHADQEAAGKTWRDDIDGRSRFEIANDKVELHKEAVNKLKSGKELPLGEVLPHDRLFKNYPGMENKVTVRVDHDLPEGIDGVYRRGDKAGEGIITIHPGMMYAPESLRNLVLHETQHHVQGIENFAKGANGKLFFSEYPAQVAAAKRAKMIAHLNGVDTQKIVDALTPTAKARFEDAVGDVPVELHAQRARMLLEGDYLNHFKEGTPESLIKEAGDARRQHNDLTDEHSRAAQAEKDHEDSAHSMYLRSHGEMEARNVEYRSRQTQEWLDKHPFNDTMGKAEGNINRSESINIRDYSSNMHAPKIPQANERASRPEAVDVREKPKAASDTSKSSEEPTTLEMAAEEDNRPEAFQNLSRDYGEAKTRIKDLAQVVKDLFKVNPVREISRQLHVGWLAAHDRKYTTAERGVHQYKVLFDKMRRSERLQLIDDWQTGKPITNPDARAFFEMIAPMYKDAIDYIRSVNPELLKNMNDRYLGQIWEKTNKDTPAFLTKMGLSGGKNFLKAKMYKTMKEGMEKGGLTPKTTNPVEISMIKLGEILKFAGMLRMQQEYKARDYMHDWALGKDPPDGWARVNDPAFLGKVVKAEIANDLNAYLSRGLSDVPGFKKIRYVENMMVAGKLGWSGFHAGFTTMDNMVTGAETSLRRTLIGDFKGALVGVMKTVISPIHAPYEGGIHAKVYFGADIKDQSPFKQGLWKFAGGIDEHTQALHNLLEKGGSRVFMDPSEFNAGISKEIQAFRQRDIKRGIQYAIPALADASGWFIHRKLVPAQKMSARLLLLKFELDRFASKLGKEYGDYSGIIDAMAPDAAAQISRKVNGLVDDRLGHMSYDVQFWNPFAQHMAQLTIMAPGWVAGTLRTVGGGVGDLVRLAKPEKINGPLDKAGMIKDAHFGRLTSRTSNLIVLSALTAAASGSFMYMMTGQWPQEPKDYVHPKTGRKNADGTDERISWPTYAKEHFALATHPVRELLGKLNQPLIKMTYELLNNADYTNTEIYNSHAPVAKQAKEIMGYFASGFTQPIVVSNAQRADKMAQLNPDTPKTNKAMQIAGFFGVTHARQELDHSEAENFINQKYFNNFAKGTLSKAKKEEITQKGLDLNALRRGETIDESSYNAQQLTKMHTAAEGGTDKAEENTFSLRFKEIKDLEDKLQAWEMASPEERVKFNMKESILEKADDQLPKISDPEQRAKAQKQIDEIEGGQ